MILIIDTDLVTGANFPHRKVHFGDVGMHKALDSALATSLLFNTHTHPNVKIPMAWIF